MVYDRIYTQGEAEQLKVAPKAQTGSLMELSESPNWSFGLVGK